MEKKVEGKKEITSNCNIELLNMKKGEQIVYLCFISFSCSTNTTARVGGCAFLDYTTKCDEIYFQRLRVLVNGAPNSGYVTIAI